MNPQTKNRVENARVPRKRHRHGIISNNLIILANCYYIFMHSHEGKFCLPVILSLKQKNNAILDEKNHDYACQNRFLS